MKIIELASKVWFRAQGIYLLLHVFGLLIGTGVSLFTGDADSAIGFLLLLGFFSCGSALVCGVPAWLAFSAVLAITAPAAARFRVLLPLILVAGLLATHGALYLGFDVLFSASLGAGDRDLILLFSTLAYGSMAASVMSLRRAIARLADPLSASSNHTPALPDAEA